ncbi:MAG: hypothetical protein H6R18_1666, partial [Proteobacteria bacterium]|nr:hypothetical protein [Pseudomonadota bacterium]
VAVTGIDGAGVDVVGQRDDAAEAPGKAFVNMDGSLFLLGWQIVLAFAGNGQYAFLNLYVNRGRVDTGGEDVDLYRLGCMADIHGRKAAARQTANAGGKIDGLLQFALQPIQFRKQIAGKQGSIHSLILHLS